MTLPVQLQEPGFPKSESCCGQGISNWMQESTWINLKREIITKAWTFLVKSIYFMVTLGLDCFCNENCQKFFGSPEGWCFAWEAAWGKILALDLVKNEVNCLLIDFTFA